VVLQDLTVTYDGKRLDGATWDELLVEDVTAFTARIDAELAVIAGLTPPRRHIYKNGRTLCGDKQYKTGFSPCELAYAGETMNTMDALTVRDRRLSDADMQAACDILGLSRCTAGEAQDRVDAKRALRKALVTHESERRRKGLGLATPEYVADIIKAKELGLISEDEAIRRSLGDYNE